MLFFLRTIFLVIAVAALVVMNTLNSNSLYINKEINLHKNSNKETQGMGLIYIEQSDSFKFYRQILYNALSKSGLEKQKVYEISNFSTSKNIFFTKNYNFCKNNELTYISESNRELKCLSELNIRNSSIKNQIQFFRVNEVYFIEPYNKNIDLKIVCRNLDVWKCNVEDFYYKSSLNSEIENAIKCENTKDYAAVLKKYYDQLIVPHLDRLLECNDIDVSTKNKIQSLKQFKQLRAKSFGI